MCHYLWFFEGSPQGQVPGSEGRQSSRWGGGGQTPGPAGESSARGEAQPGPAAEAGEAGDTWCFPRIRHFVAYFFTLLVAVSEARRSTGRDFRFQCGHNKHGNTSGQTSRFCSGSQAVICPLHHALLPGPVRHSYRLSLSVQLTGGEQSTPDNVATAFYPPFWSHSRYQHILRHRARLKLHCEDSNASVLANQESVAVV